MNTPNPALAERLWQRHTLGQKLARTAFWLGIGIAVLLSLRNINVIWEFLWDAPEQMLDMVRRMFPPDYAYYRVAVHTALMETFHIATLGTIFALVAALPLSILAAHNLTPNRGLNFLAKTLLVASRSVNSLVWALLFIAVFGPGPLAGTAAIACRSVGFIGKLLGEALVAHLDFTWCRSTVFPEEPLQIRHREREILLHLPALVANVLSQPQDAADALETQFLALLTDWLVWYQEYHWLTALTLPDWEETAYTARFGVCPPPTLRRRLRLLLEYDEEHIIRHFGSSMLLPPLAILEQHDWNTLESAVFRLEQDSSRQHGSAWREQAAQNAQTHGDNIDS